MARTWAVMFSLAVLAAGSSLGDAAAPTAPRQRAADRPDAWPEEAAPELRRIQRALGGSIVEGFGELPRGAPRPATADDQRAGPANQPSGRQRQRAVEALREAAAQLDMSANRLEALELYRQADALRAEAQRLRLDARGMLNPSKPEPQPAFAPARPATPSPESPLEQAIRTELSRPQLPSAAAAEQ
jgi:hypothetical protein